ncbi:MAG: PQQ-dependent sugar dehydrogenase [Bacteroidetes bacterium]|nr:PQQ-dependent sugar dehydrogenase [Bacteroidota bacterium]
MRLPISVLCALAIASSTGTRAQELDLVEPFPNLSFSTPVDFQHADDASNTLYIVEQAGIILSFENDETTTSTTTFLDIQNRVYFLYERGLLGLAFHPDFETNGYFYVDYTTTGALRTRISRFNLDAGNPDVADPNSEVVLLEVDQPAKNHNAGQIAFGPDGYLYVTLGDGGGGGDPSNNGQDPSTLLGSILRLDVDGTGNPLDCGSGTGSATIPVDNPLVDGEGGNCDEIYAYGLRNPFRMSFDPATGDMWVGDVGQNAWEEVDLITAGGNFGWRVYEGSRCTEYDPCDPSGKIFPIWEYPHDPGILAVIGGYVYRGLAIPELAGKYIYGDLGGLIWSLDTSGGSPVNEEIGSLAGCCLTSFGIDHRGEIYVLTIDGPIRKFIRVPPVAGEEALSRLSPSLDIHGPNPVSGRTSLRFLAPSEGHVLLAVYDILGREVARLFDREVRSLTLRDVTFDATNLPAGAYVARLITGGTIATQKLTVVR